MLCLLYGIRNREFGYNVLAFPMIFSDCQYLINIDSLFEKLREVKNMSGFGITMIVILLISMIISIPLSLYVRRKRLERERKEFLEDYKQVIEEVNNGKH